MRIIPAIDIIEGKCVRLTQGDYSQKKIYNENPLEIAKMFENEGFRYLHLVDLDGAKAKKVINLKVLEEIASKTSLQIDFGGGVQTDEDLQKVFEAGAKQVTAGSIAVRNPAKVLEWLGKYGAERIILGADVRNECIAMNGWQETSTQDIWEFLDFYQKQGIQYVICTDVSKDGLLQGTAIELYEKILQKFPQLKLIASGGVSNLQDIEILQKIGLEGVIIGKAIYEKRISLQELNTFLSK
ncbi:MAG: 1-(5-phosphoribosyl)-5-[(5-phosphoribosylamino)methylideneamino]imidazole-4-carboxamide isomerase [Raineya sp.]|nr:1-(5-phosphoribosyl)-5-[(5-phosphoribosylamino)methylideneamino]imidazole-4-carboxamide isomerase [Raineya sp.]MDW8296958.1 1-(5-phosphoribosyl)-5-[(5-phosphoribosylamino)methylideneamino]imidazole-4-carboxamide isomerase [Raineya sp.]